MHRCLYEYDEEEAREVWREDALEEGARNQLRRIVEKLARNKTPELIAQELDEPLEYIQELLSEAKEEVL